MRVRRAVGLADRMPPGGAALGAQLRPWRPPGVAAACQEALINKLNNTKAPGLSIRRLGDGYAGPASPRPAAWSGPDRRGTARGCGTAVKRPRGHPPGRHAVGRET